MSDTVIETPIVATPSEDSPVNAQPTPKDPLTKICVVEIDSVDEAQEESLADGVKFKRVYKVMKCNGDDIYVEACKCSGQMRPKNNKLMLLDEIFEWKLAAQIVANEKAADITDQKRLAIIDLTEFPYVSTHVDYRDQTELLGNVLSDKEFLSQILTYWDTPECKGQWVCALIINTNLNHVTFRLLNSSVYTLFRNYEL